MILVSEYIKLPKEARQAHLDLASPCIERGGSSTQHRAILAYVLDTDIATGVCCCHACSNGKCSNPKHLYWGTYKENSLDALADGNPTPWDRMVKKYGKEGALEKLKLLRFNSITARRAASKLTDDQVRHLRSLPVKYGMASEWGRIFGVGRHVIHNVLANKSYQHVQ